MPNPLGDSPVAEANPLGDSEVAGNPLGDRQVEPEPENMAPGADILSESDSRVEPKPAAPKHGQVYQPGEVAPGMTEQEAAEMKDLARGSRTEGSFAQRRLAPAAAAALSGVDLPDLPEGVTAASGAVGAVAGALYKGAIKPAVNAVTAPAGLVLAPLGISEAAGSVLAKVVGKGVSGAFAADMLKSGTDEAKEALNVLKDQNATDEQKLTAVTKAAGTLGFGVLAGAHAVLPGHAPAGETVEEAGGEARMPTLEPLGPQDVAREAINAKYGSNPLDDKPVEAPAATNPVGDAVVEDPVADHARYQQIHAEMRQHMKNGTLQSPEFTALWQENEDIKNRNSSDPGMPPEAPGEPDRTTDFSMPEENPFKAAADQLKEMRDSDLGDTTERAVARIGKQDVFPQENVEKAVDETLTEAHYHKNSQKVFGERPLTEGEKKELFSTFFYHITKGISSDQLPLDLERNLSRTEDAARAWDSGSSKYGVNPRPVIDAAADLFKKAFLEGEGKQLQESKETPEPTDYGIAARVTADRAEAGAVEPVEPGTGISAEKAVEQGREDLKAGADPQAALDRFTETGAINGRDIGLVRAHGEKLAQAARDATRTHGVESPEYDAAAKADSDWTAAIKPMQTEWHRAGQVMQGSTDIDTGDFHSLRTKYQKATGKDFTPAQAGRAKKVAAVVQDATEGAEAAKAKVIKAISEEVPEPAKPKGKRVVQAFKDRADAAMARLREKAGQARTGLDPTDLRDYAEVAAYHIVRGVDAAAEMVKTFGEHIRDHLPEILEKAKSVLAESDRSVAGVWKKAKDYIAAGETDFDTIRHKIATDLGMSVREVTERLTEPKSTRVITNEMYKKMADQRAVIEQAKTWLKNEQTPRWLRITRALPSAFFKLYTFGHGTVGMITHNAVSMFNPTAWRSYWPNFFRQFKLIGFHDRGAFHEMMMQELSRDPNFITAKRAGLANDPFHYTDDYQKGWLGSHLQRIGLTGNRGFDALKLFRQDMFNRTWNQLPDSMKTSRYAQLLADGINHASGAIKTRFPEWTNWTFFAPKLEGSRWAWMIGDPAKAARIITEWKTATPEEHAFAIREVKQKALIAGTYLSLLAMNQGLLKATGSKQQVNFTDPERSDFLAFKGGGMKFGVVGPMLGIVRLFANLMSAAVDKRTGFRARESRADEMAGVVKDYARGKLSPFAGVATDVATQSDFQGRPLPFSKDKVPSFLAKQGVKRYTYGEYAGERLLPIPVSEAVREVWRKQGMNETDIEHWMKALGSAALMGGTGARMSDDFYIGKPPGTHSGPPSVLHRRR